MSSVGGLLLGGVYSALLPGSKKNSVVSERDNAAQQLAERGSYIPWIRGRARVGAVFGWVGARTLSQQKRGGKNVGGIAGGGSKVTAGAGQVYAESGWHMLCVGQAKKIRKIYQAGKPIMTTAINSTSHPSGTLIDLGEEGKFKVYWGENSQPIDALLSFYTGIASKWPYVCHIVWISKRLGPAPRWPLLEYDIETDIVGASGLDDTSTAIDAYDSGLDAAGLNPAHVLAALLFQNWPYGLGIPTADFDLDSFEAVGTLLLAEKLPCGIFAQDGKTALAVLGELMTEMGLMLAWDPYAISGEGRWKLLPIRATTAVAIPDAAVMSRPQIERSLFRKESDRTLFSFADRSYGYRPSTIAVDDDGVADYAKFHRANTIALETVQHFKWVGVVAIRRSQEESVKAARVEFEAGRNSFLLYPGLLVTIPDFPFALRITDVEYQTETTRVKVTAIQDVYSIPAVPDTLEVPETPVSAGSTTPADLQATFLEIPPHASGVTGQVLIGVLRIRGGSSVPFAIEHFSSNGTSYTEEGSDSTFQTGGEIRATYSIAEDTGSYYIAQGPRINLAGFDAAQVMDLSSDLAGWRAGKQIVLIGSELFFMKKLTAISDNIFRMDGLLRARYDTIPEAHAAGDKVFIFKRDVKPFTDSLICLPGVNLRVKPQPVGLGGAYSLAGITAISKTLTGKGLIPSRPGKPRVTAPRKGVYTYLTGEDVTFKWAWRAFDKPRSGAGLQGAGEACFQSVAEGDFEFEVRTTGGTLVRTEILSSATYTYTNADLVADLGSEDDFKARVRNVLGIWSDYVTVEFSS